MHYTSAGNSHSSLNKKRTFMWNQTQKWVEALLAPIIWICHSKIFSLYATWVSSENESARPVRYHQHPRAPADLFAETIEQTRSLDIADESQTWARGVVAQSTLLSWKGKDLVAQSTVLSWKGKHLRCVHGVPEPLAAVANGDPVPRKLCSSLLPS